MIFHDFVLSVIERHRLLFKLLIVFFNLKLQLEQPPISTIPAYGRYSAIRPVMVIRTSLGPDSGMYFSLADPIIIPIPHRSAGKDSMYNIIGAD